MAETFDAFDRAILRELQADGRLSITDLAARIGLSPTPCQRRVKRLEDAGLIAGYHARLSRPAVGRGLTVFVYLKVAAHDACNAETMQQALLALPDAVACYIVSGEADFMLELALPDLAAYEVLMFETLLKLPMIKDLRSSFVLRTLRQNGPLAL